MVQSRRGCGAALFFGLWLVIDQSCRHRFRHRRHGRRHLTSLHLLRRAAAAATIVNLPLNPGFVDYRVGLPRGSARNAFELISSLLPGSVPTNETEAAIEYHCLDLRSRWSNNLAAKNAPMPAWSPGGAMDEFCCRRRPSCC
jgi:hypothetical protein